MTDSTSIEEPKRTLLERLLCFVMLHDWSVPADSAFVYGVLTCHRTHYDHDTFARRKCLRPGCNAEGSIHRRWREPKKPRQPLQEKQEGA